MPPLDGMPGLPPPLARRRSFLEDLQCILYIFLVIGKPWIGNLFHCNDYVNNIAHREIWSADRTSIEENAGADVTEFLAGISLDGLKHPSTAAFSVSLKKARNVLPTLLEATTIFGWRFCIRLGFRAIAIRLFAEDNWRTKTTSRVCVYARARVCCTVGTKLFRRMANNLVREMSGERRRKAMCRRKICKIFLICCYYVMVCCQIFAVVR